MNFNLAKNLYNEKDLSLKPMRDGAGIGVMELGETKENVVVLAADTAESSRAHFFAEKFPSRFIQCGVAEQDMIGISAGLSYENKVPYAFTYAAFLIGRPWEPIRTIIAYPERHVVFVSFTNPP